MLVSLVSWANFVLSFVTLLVGAYFLINAIRSLHLNKMEGRQRAANIALVVFILLIVTTSGMNLLIRYLDFIRFPGRHEVSIYRSFLTQILALASIWLYKKI